MAAEAREKAAPWRIPILRWGKEYESLDSRALADHRSGEALASIDQANAGLVRRDLAQAARRKNPLRDIPMARLFEICASAADHFDSGELALCEGGPKQGVEDYVECLSRTGGLPHALVRRNMEKITLVLREMPQIVAGLTRGLDPALLDRGMGAQDGRPMCFAPRGDSLGVILPSNSPGVNSLWLPALALKTPVVLKPGREEPWTPMRLLRAFLAAGLPPEAVAFLPTDHEGAAAILEGSGRSLLFGDASTTARWAADPRVEIHGPGRSKVLLGPDMADDWEGLLDIILASILDGGGRSCINASTVLTPAHGAEIANALAERMAELRPLPAQDPEARPSAFANPKMAAAIDASIESALAAGGARDLALEKRASPRRQEVEGATYLLPTLVACDSIEHPLARSEYLFPFASVVQVPAADLLSSLGPSLVVAGLTRDPQLVDGLLRAHGIERLNLGPMPTTRVEWDQPHEGNLFEHLWERRAIQRAAW
jgi:hypothetical protein